MKNTTNVHNEFWSDPTEWPEPIDQLNISKLTRQKIFKEESAKTMDVFIKSEWKQLDRYLEVRMFGEPCDPPPGAKVLPWVWTYMYKENTLTGIDKPKA